MSMPDEWMPGRHFELWRITIHDDRCGANEPSASRAASCACAPRLARRETSLRRECRAAQREAILWTRYSRESSQAALLPGESGNQPSRAADVWRAIARECALRARDKSPDRRVGDAEPHRPSFDSIVAIRVGHSGHSLRVLLRLRALHLVEGEQRCASEAEYALLRPPSR
jgi:hypothetical protein